jgi:hypothetical protein
MKVVGTLLFHNERLALEFLEAIFPDFEFEIRIGKTEKDLKISAVSSYQVLFFEGQLFDIYPKIFKALDKQRKTKED